MFGTSMEVTGYAERTYSNKDWEGKYPTENDYRMALIGKINCGDMVNVKGQIVGIDSGGDKGITITYFMTGIVDTGCYDEGEADAYVAQKCSFGELYDVEWN
ncbi:hypothetical protein [Schwartzia sp. (in: firmicutes)]|nr:hypothetical protein [Schwartzia sp. (in: firmicutes)]